MDTVELFERAAAGFRTRLQKVTDWSVATPCTEWDARALVNHVQNEIMWIPPLVEGKSIADVGSSLDGDLLGEDAVAAWDAAVAAVTTIMSEPGAAGRTVHLSYGDTDARDYVEQVTSDIGIHTWDVARAVGDDDTIDADLVELAMVKFGPMFEGGRAAGVFGAAVEVPDDASPQDKLIALSGRTP